MVSGFTSALVGNQLGLELRARVGYQRRTVDSSSSPTLSLDLVAVSHAAGDRSGFRLHSLLGAVVPAVGLEVMRDRPLALRLRVLRPSVGWLLTDWLLVELEVSLLMRYELQQADQPEIGGLGIDSSLRMVMFL